MKKLILGSTSPYRKELLEKLLIPFECEKPLIDEEKEKKPHMKPQELAQHLAYLKAHSLRGPGRIIIGGDQLVSFEGKILGKPHTFEKALEQLWEMQGKSHELVTAVCVIDEENVHPFINITTMKMKKLSREQLRTYIEKDQPLDCAGAYKIEKHGLSLFESIQTNDFSAIQGLPLLELSRVLEHCGLHSPLASQTI